MIVNMELFTLKINKATCRLCIGKLNSFFKKKEGKKILDLLSLLQFSGFVLNACSPVPPYYCMLLLLYAAQVQQVGNQLKCCIHSNNLSLTVKVTPTAEWWSISLRYSFFCPFTRPWKAHFHSGNPGRVLGIKWGNKKHIIKYSALSS